MSSIYIIGDSFTAGAELIDHTFASYNKFKPTNLNEYVKWSSSKEHMAEIEYLGTNYNKSYGERFRAWPAKLGALTNSEVINAAFGGSSPEMWRSIILKEFIDFKKYDRKMDIAIIQFTNFNRVSLPSFKNGILIHNNMSGYSMEYGSEDEKRYYKARLMIQNDPGFFYTFLLDLASIKMTLNHFGVKTVKFVMSQSPALQEINEYAKINDIKILLDFLEINFDTITTMYHDNAIRLPGGHYTEETHELFAQKIKDLLKL